MKQSQQAPNNSFRRRWPIGAEYLASEGTHFRVWAPDVTDLSLELGDGSVQPMLRTEGGHHELLVQGAGPGTRYRFRMGDQQAYPDPASHSQPEGPHGPSEVVDGQAYAWRDAGWTGPDELGMVLYELHVGTFTAQGTYAAAAEQLPSLRELGVTCIELMPVNEFNGPFGWGYDGVNLFAPSHLYGPPDALRGLVDSAHALGMAVILDVVYNHFGPSGNYLTRFAKAYFTDRYANEWGDAIDFDGPASAGVREYFIANAEYWIETFHFDGFRFDATQSIFDAGQPHILAEIVERSRAVAPGRRLYFAAENEPQHNHFVRETERGGFGLDALWNDDFHHSAHVAATGGAHAYYSETRGTPQELVSAVKWGFLYQGQFYAWQKQRRGTPTLDVPARRFINFLQNHDQVANGARGLRLHQLTSPGRHRALTALMLLAPGTPLLFQGQEFAASAPFLYFARHEPELDAAVRRGRGEFLRQFPNLAGGQSSELVPDPSDEATFMACKLDHGERLSHAGTWRMHRDLLRLRREHAVFAAQDATRLHGAVLGPEALALRWLGGDGNDRLLLLNLGTSLDLRPMPEPLLASPAGTRWRVLWHSEDAAYGGNGMSEIDGEGTWMLPAHAAAVLWPSGLGDDAAARAEGVARSQARG